MLMLPLGLGIISPIADSIGIRVPYMIGGLVCTLMGITGFFVPKLMRIEADGLIKREAHTNDNNMDSNLQTEYN